MQKRRAKEPMKRISLRLTDKQLKKLARICKSKDFKEGRKPANRSRVLRTLIESYK